MDQSVKQQVSELLRSKDQNSLLDLCEKDRRFWQEVRFRLYDIDEGLRWPAIETVSKFMLRLWDSGKNEKVRIYVRTLFWSMTDESGGIGWSSPQTIAEIIVNIPELIDPYGSMMIAYSIEEPSLVKGGLWGIGRLGRRIADTVGFFKEKVLATFRSDDEETLGLAAWAMGEVGFAHALPFLNKLQLGNGPVRIYIDGAFCDKNLNQWVQEAVTKIEEAEK
jgi:hypothetical protein